MNGKISSMKIFDEIFIVAPSGDDGTVIGACYLANKMLGNKISNKKRHDFYLGSRFSDKEILDEIINQKLEYQQSKNYNCSIITMPPSIIEKISKFGKSLNRLSLDTVRKFFLDSKKSNFKL